MRSLWLNSRVKFFCLALLASLTFSSASGALEIPALEVPINDFAKMIPPASVDDLTERLKRIRSETGYNVVVLTVQSLEGEDIESFGRPGLQESAVNGEGIAEVGATYRRA